jgi:hypothetical protein
MSNKNILLILLFATIAMFALFLVLKDRFFQVPENNEYAERVPLFHPVLLDWEQTTSSTIWSKRDAHTALVFQDKIWLFGGIEGKDNFDGRYWKLIHKNDVWNSEDGKNWQLIQQSADWEPRRSLTAINFNNKIWLLGGWEKQSGLTKNDVWYSENGISWTEAVSSNKYTPREGHCAIVFDNKIWVLGGVDFDKRQCKNDVWYSEDGKNWQLAASSSPWSPRYDHTVTVFKNKMWLIGGVGLDQDGDAKNDIWVSENGKDWEVVETNVVLPQRHGHTSLVYEDRIWLISGWNTQDDKGLKDVWWSRDGYYWRKTSKDAPWLGREDHTSVVFDGKIWLFGGMDTNWEWKNDVWYSYINL